MKTGLKNIVWDLLIEDLAEKLGLAQSELAEKLGVTQQSISGWSKGRTTPSNAPRLAIRDLALEAGLDLKNYKTTSKKIEDLANNNSLSGLGTYELLQLAKTDFKNGLLAVEAAIAKFEGK